MMFFLLYLSANLPPKKFKGIIKMVYKVKIMAISLADNISLPDKMKVKSGQTIEPSAVIVLPKKRI